jgi:hypothetical protein
MSSKDGTTIITFGMYNGKTLEEIPSDYLKYVINNTNDEDLAEAADAEYEWRTEWKKHF